MAQEVACEVQVKAKLLNFKNIFFIRELLTVVCLLLNGKCLQFLLETTYKTERNVLVKTYDWQRRILLLNQSSQLESQFATANDIIVKN